MRSIPQKLRKQIAIDPRLKKCWFPGCNSLKVEINHTFIYSGRQVNAMWAFSALCEEHHRTGDDSFHKNKKTREFIELECLKNVDISSLMRAYPRRNWVQEIKYLNSKYGPATKPD